METIDEYSYGVVPFYNFNGVWKVFLIQQRGRRGDLLWTFPKGHQEGSETKLETAKRELYEETGIQIPDLDESNPFTQKYTFSVEEKLINKESIYFAGIPNSPSYSLPKSVEVLDGGWYTFDEARERITFPQAKALFEEVIATFLPLKS